MKFLANNRHIANNPALYTPQIERNFDFIIYGIESLINPLTNEPFVNGKESITISCENATGASRTASSVAVNYGNLEIKLSSGKVRFGNISLTVNDFTGANAYGIFTALQKLHADAENGSGGIAAYIDNGGYMFVADIVYRMTNGRINRVEHNEYCFVTDVGGKRGNRGSDGVQTFDVTIATSLVTDRAVE